MDRNTVITPATPCGPSTGTDHEPATFADLARFANSAQPRPPRTSSAMTGSPVAAAIPGGPPAAPNGSFDPADSSGAATPSEAAQASWPPGTRGVDSRPLASAPPSAGRISAQL